MVELITGPEGEGIVRRDIMTLLASDPHCPQAQHLGRGLMDMLEDRASGGPALAIQHLVQQPSLDTMRRDILMLRLHDPRCPLASLLERALLASSGTR